LELNLIDLRHFRHGNLPESFRQLLIDMHDDAYATPWTTPSTSDSPGSSTTGQA